VVFQELMHEVKLKMSYFLKYILRKFTVRLTRDFGKCNDLEWFSCSGCGLGDEFSNAW
jgi:hypothetical protein